MKRSLLAAVLLAAAVPSEALAGGLALGARLGYVSPRGKLDANEKLADSIDWAWPIQLDAGFQGEQVMIGGYLRLAPGKLDPALQSGCIETCKVTDYGVGAQVNFRFQKAAAGPWVGAFLGYEVLKYEATFGGQSASISPSGWELGAQGGIDFALGPLTLGPYASISTAQFTKSTYKGGGTSDTQTITDKASHTWLGLGLRAGIVF